MLAKFVLIRSEVLLRLPDYEITAVDQVGGMVHTSGTICGESVASALWRNEAAGQGPAVPCPWPQLVAAVFGSQAGLRATQPFRRSIWQKHFDGISRRRLAERGRLSSARIERWFR